MAAAIRLQRLAGDGEIANAGLVDAANRSCYSSPTMMMIRTFNIASAFFLRR
jgi:hypothetical protein